VCTVFGKRFGKRSKAAGGQVGLAVTDDSITAVHILPQAEQAPKLLARFDGPSHDDGSALAAWVSAHRLQGVPAALTLDQGDYVIHQLEKPDVPAEELRQALRWRLKDLIDYSPADAVIDVFETPPARQKRIEPVQVVAAQASRLKPLVARINSTGLVLKRIDIAEFALRNLLSRALGSLETTALLYLRPQRSMLQICREDQFYFARALDLGLEALSHAAHGGAYGGLADVHDRIALEVQRTMDYYESYFGHGPVKALIILGRGDAAEHLVDYIRNALGLSARLVGPADLLSGLDDPDSVAEAMPLALGGALGMA